MLTLLLGTTMAAEPLDDLDAALDRLGRLQPAVDLVRPIDEPFTVTDGPLVLSFDSGWLIPVFAGVPERTPRPDDRRNLAIERLELASEGLDASLLGFAWVGEGTATMYFAKPGEALRFANNQVRTFGEERSAFAPIARREAPYSTTTSRGFVLGEVPGLFDLIWPEGPPDPNEVFAYRTSAEARRAADRAATTMLERVDLYDRVYGDFQRELGWLRLASEVADGPAPVFTDVYTSGRFGAVDVGGVAATPQDRWLGSAPTGSDSAYAQHVRSLGLVHDQTGVGGVIHTGGLRATVDDETGPPVSPDHVVPGRAHVDLYVQREPAGVELLVEARTTLEIHAEGGDVAWIDLDLAPLQQGSERFELTSLETADGKPLRASQRGSFDPLRPAATDLPEVDPLATGTADIISSASSTAGIFRAQEAESTQVRRQAAFRAVLPEPLRDGESTRVVLGWTDRWQLRNGDTCFWLASSALDERPVRATGTGTGTRVLLPGLRGTQEAFEVTYRLHQPKGEDLAALAAGAVVGEGEGEAWRHVDYDLGHARQPSLAFGKWSAYDRKAQNGTPPVVVRLRRASDRALRAVPRELDQIFGYFGSVLPTHPFETVHVFEGPPTCDQTLRWPTSHETVELYQAVFPDSRPITRGPLKSNNPVVPRNNEPALESQRLAAAIARGWWFHGTPPASREDAWLNHALTWGMACMYVGAAHGPDACDIRLAGAERRLLQPMERAAPHPLTQPDGGTRFRRESVGPYVLFHMLRRRIGNRAFFAGLRGALEDHPGEGITTDRLRTYFSEASDTDLQPFFDFWVEGGLIPTVQLHWEEAEHGVATGEVHSDVPFGEFDVRVVVSRDNGYDEARWVRVVDGVGTFEFVGGNAVTDVALDPEGLTLARHGRVAKR
jgi:hypothetical protein